MISNSTTGPFESKSMTIPLITHVMYAPLIQIPHADLDRLLHLQSTLTRTQAATYAFSSGNYTYITSS